MELWQRFRIRRDKDGKCRCGRGCEQVWGEQKPETPLHGVYFGLPPQYGMGPIDPWAGERD